MAILEQWRLRVQNGHQPYRRDCKTCVPTMGRDQQHRRVYAPEPYCASLDVTGPFKMGFDQELRIPKYILVAAYAIPVDQSTNVLAEQLVKFGARLSVDAPLCPDPMDPTQDVLRPDPPPPDADRLPADPEEEPPAALTGAEVKLCDVDYQRWQEHVAELSIVLKFEP